MKTITANHGMGMMEFEFHTKKAFGQVGAIDEFQSVVAYFPSDSLAIAFCSNGRVGNTKNLVLEVLNIYFDQKYENPDFRLLSTHSKAKGLLKYSGIYSNRAIPLRIIVSAHNQELVAQPIGQRSYTLNSIASNKFKCDALGAIIEFNRDSNEFILYQGDMRYNFIKEH
jgi:hypothetical protein